MGTSEEVFRISLGEDKDPCPLCAGSLSLLQCLGRGSKSGSLVGGLESHDHNVPRIHHDDDGMGLRAEKLFLTCELVAFIYGFSNNAMGVVG